MAKVAKNGKNYKKFGKNYFYILHFIFILNKIQQLKKKKII